MSRVRKVQSNQRFPLSVPGEDISAYSDTKKHILGWDRRIHGFTAGVGKGNEVDDMYSV